MTDKLDLDLTSPSSGLSMPDRIDQTWVVRVISEHDARLIDTDRRIDVHAEKLVHHDNRLDAHTVKLTSHDEEHVNLREGYAHVHNQLTEHSALQQAHFRQFVQLVQQINAKQDAAADRQLRAANAQADMHETNHAAFEDESQRADWRAIAIIGVSMLLVVIILLRGPWS